MCNDDIEIVDDRNDFIDIQFKPKARSNGFELLLTYLTTKNNFETFQKKFRMIVYVHLESTLSPGCSLKFDMEGSCSVETLSQEVIKKLVLNNIIPHTASIQLRDSIGTLLKPPAELLLNLVLDGEDIFVEVLTSVDSKPIVAIPTDTVPVSQPEGQSHDGIDANLSLSEFREKVSEYLDKSQYRKIRLLCNEYLNLKTVTNPSFKSVLFYYLSRVHLINERYDQAVEFCEKALNFARRAKEVCTTMAQLYCHLAECHYRSGNFDECESVADEVFQCFGGIDSALSSSVSSLAYEALRWKAESIFEMGRHMPAANLVNKYITTSNGENKVPLLQAYSYFALKYDKFDDGLRALLKAVVIDKNDKRTCQLLANALKSPEGIDQLKKQIVPSAQSSSGFAFLATICKEYGAITACSELLKTSLAFSPQLSTVLALVHNLELTFDYDMAINVFLLFMRSNLEMKVGKNGFSCQQIVEIFDNSSDKVSRTSNHDGLYRDNIALKWQSRGLNEGDVDHCVFLEKDNYLLGNEIVYSEERIDDSKETFSSEDLDLLALAATAVKILYFSGRFSVLPMLIKLIESTRLLSETPLHETLIRNEMSYFTCIVQVLSSRPAIFPFNRFADPYLAAFSDPMMLGKLPEMAEKVEDFVWNTATNTHFYVTGDSHLIPLAWNFIKMKEEWHILIPKLTTGIKHWHLRPSSEFYTKYNLMYALQSIPVNSKVAHDIYFYSMCNFD